MDEYVCGSSGVCNIHSGISIDEMWLFHFITGLTFK